ncbi:ribonuclease P protein component [Caldimonas sp.]|uniref:ribonuclease P protein component n=1 Tax=Caldimonas sp. TaxID=2838790 RepID=UPI00307CE3B6
MILPAASTRLVRLSRRADFERVLGAGASAIAARSPHFVLHHLPNTDELSTGGHPEGALPVDVFRPAARELLVGVVIPKRWARRAVTRNLLKRQMYAAFARHAPALPGGMWVVRLRAAFDRERFPSADSKALRRVVRSEVDALMQAAVRQRTGRAA